MATAVPDLAQLDRGRQQCRCDQQPPPRPAAQRQAERRVEHEVDDDVEQFDGAVPADRRAQVDRDRRRDHDERERR
jgi:hypothetical protein